MFTATIKWDGKPEIITHDTVAGLLAWLTNLYDATGQRPEVFDNSGNRVAIGYSERGRAQLR